MLDDRYAAVITLRMKLPPRKFTPCSTAERNLVAKAQKMVWQQFPEQNTGKVVEYGD